MTHPHRPILIEGRDQGVLTGPTVEAQIELKRGGAIMAVGQHQFRDAIANGQLLIRGLAKPDQVLRHVLSRGITHRTLLGMDRIPALALQGLDHRHRGYKPVVA